MGKFRNLSYSTDQERQNREEFASLFNNSPIPLDELIFNLQLYLNRQSLSHLLFINELYQNVLKVHGDIFEFGVRWGRNMALFEVLRGIYEPYNQTRKIVGYDTFSGFPSVHEKDGQSKIIQKNAYSVTDNYDDYLTKVLNYHESENPRSYIKKHKLIKGDATVKLEKYLLENPQTIIALAYFDFDIYEPTKKCLELIKNHITKGSIIGFDQLNHPDFPGETIALKEVFGLDRYRIMRSPYNSYTSYIIID
ncbi:crotonobetainyl-CoA--carnitine CoA-transferase [Metabacillus fastidiosus]|uniref:crotonobetainyl-CoA--carnitine CoA-transferase n=1 Tax=Metabacillus fastidiosus TaxID=1458 RepID=UPI002E20BD8B|nr:TylF/MycF/NovP-related O-methyltransferase [Metabacillus fastidiosus]